MALGEKWSERLADLLDLPRDVVLDLPRIILTGNRRLVVENHKGVIEYTSELLRLNTAKGELRIRGEGLVLPAIFREEVWVEGRLQQLEFYDWGD
ncbi:MAG TPA: sporulation protein YqfC [Firmicutes bacterium]|jgi:sporulation protein YqfC|nr:sporulation protein YqfC [Bacillota bacterium]HOQ24211.1 sporulation protein YqfC [Bacillota bacterium]HPT67629.1 sporulation protein YqfC [Bacillota bacterium]